MSEGGKGGQNKRKNAVERTDRRFQCKCRGHQDKFIVAHMHQICYENRLQFLNEYITIIIMGSECECTPLTSMKHNCEKRGFRCIMKCVQFRSGCTQPFTCYSAGRHIDSFDLYKSILAALSTLFYWYMCSQLTQNRNGNPSIKRQLGCTLISISLSHSSQMVRSMIMMIYTRIFVQSPLSNCFMSNQ